MKVLYATSEARPFAASGGLADVAGSLPKAIRGKGVACRVVMPLYGDISEEWRSKMTYLCNFQVDVAWRKQYCGLFEYNYNGVIFYFIDNEYYFKRPGLYGYYDDAERFAFFSRAVLQMLWHVDFMPDIIHCNDWQTAMVPVYQDLFYRYCDKFSNIKTVFTIHNIQYQGKYGFELMQEVLGVPDYAKPLMQYDDCLNMMKAAIEVSNQVTTVSPTYAQELLDPWYSHGMDRELIHHQGKMRGILNGIDYETNNPETDPDIAAHFSVKDLSGKRKNKKALMEEVGLPYSDEPLVGIVTRMVDHKGLDLVQYAFENLVNNGFKFVVLGSGDYGYENFFQAMKEKYPDRVSTTLGFIPALAKKIYAGADMFLMPSKSEPCGLAQMIALRYGTVPIVRETGGLKDSIQDCSLGSGNGFTFSGYDGEQMKNALYRAKEVYYKKDEWESLVKYGMSCDLSWKNSAAQYIEMYEDVLRF
ncbi:glycogen synthase GlgA [Clostridium facile]|uniref:Glycogen synthase n=1 Tax=Clostridium facile TaxID=2763035 RepID=A0ABR7IRA4_9CLOT|nr:glycogen synthase GlgA [Clostridium facile]MBC5787670.1 glycogen synthase GlgA [Clostridium facile]